MYIRLNSIQHALKLLSTIEILYHLCKCHESIRLNYDSFREEFAQNGMDNVVTIECRDACEQGKIYSFIFITPQCK